MDTPAGLPFPERQTPVRRLARRVRQGPWGRIAAIGFGLLALVTAVCWGGLELQDYATATVCCGYGLELAGRELNFYARAHDGRLPPAGQWRSVVTQEGRQMYLGYVECHGSHMPFQWDERWAGEPIVQPTRIAIGWCPPGGHSRHLPVLTIGPNGLEAIVVPAAELRNLYHYGGPHRPDTPQFEVAGP